MFYYLIHLVLPTIGASPTVQNLNVNTSTAEFSPSTSNPTHWPSPVPPPSPSSLSFLMPYGHVQPSPATSTSSCAGGSTPADGLFSNYQKSGRMSLSVNVERLDSWK